MAVNITVERDGIPVTINARQEDGSLKEMKFFVSTSDENISNLIMVNENLKLKAIEVQKKYPILKGESPIESNNDVKNVMQGLKEVLEPAYNSFLGKNSYEQIKDSGIGSAQAFELFQKITAAVSDEIDYNNKKAQQLSQKQAMKYAVKKKKMVNKSNAVK